LYKVQTLEQATYVLWLYHHQLMDQKIPGFEESMVQLLPRVVDNYQDLALLDFAFHFDESEVLGSVLRTFCQARQVNCEPDEDSLKTLNVLTTFNQTIAKLAQQDVAISAQDCILLLKKMPQNVPGSLEMRERVIAAGVGRAEKSSSGDEALLKLVSVSERKQEHLEAWLQSEHEVRLLVSALQMVDAEDNDSQYETLALKIIEEIVATLTRNGQMIADAVREFHMTPWLANPTYDIFVERLLEAFPASGPLDMVNVLSALPEGYDLEAELQARFLRYSLDVLDGRARACDWTPQERAEFSLALAEWRRPLFISGMGGCCH
jgi:hypothetical protein